MFQASLLAFEPKFPNGPEWFDMPDAEVLFYRGLFPKIEADRLFQILRKSQWKQESIKIYGKQVDIPRLTAWHGEPNTIYTYSGIRVESSPWTPELLEIKRRIEEVSGTTFNSVLLNFYRDGRDSVAWHADDEPELGCNPAIGSVSFGATRKFQMKHKTGAARPREFELENGSYLLMRGATQHNWLHQVPKTKRLVGKRINLTFRKIVDYENLQ